MNRTTAAWLAQLLERQSVVRGGRGFEPQTNTQGLKITEENVVPLEIYLQMIRLSGLLG